MKIRVLLVPYDSGYYRERMGRGPEHLLAHAVGPQLTSLGHDFDVVEVAAKEAFSAEIKTCFAVCRAVAEQVRECRREGRFPLVLSGNCNAAVGMVSGCGCAETGLVWFDAHGEATTPDTTTSGFLDGMGISTLTGRCWRSLANSIPGFEPVPGERIVLVGARDLEASEEVLLKEAGVRRVPRAEDLRDAVSRATAGCDGAYLHFDLDVLDPAEAVANQWPTPGGLTLESMVRAVKEVGQWTHVRAAGFASYDPDADRDGNAGRAAARIVEAIFGPG
jgi:arginase